MGTSQSTAFILIKEQCLSHKNTHTENKSVTHYTHHPCIYIHMCHACVFILHPLLFHKTSLISEVFIQLTLIRDYPHFDVPHHPRHNCLYCLYALIDLNQWLPVSQREAFKENSEQKCWDLCVFCDEALVIATFCCFSFNQWGRGCQRWSKVNHERYEIKKNVQLLVIFCCCRSEQESGSGRDWVPGILRPGQLRAGGRERGLGGVWRLGGWLRGQHTMLSFIQLIIICSGLSSGLRRQLHSSMRGSVTNTYLSLWYYDYGAVLKIKMCNVTFWF